MDHAELLGVETSILRALCLSVNSETSEVGRRITSDLVEEDFYFPITRSIFSTVLSMSHEGTNVSLGTLHSTLAQRAVTVPDDFFVEDLFAGAAPALDELNDWIGTLKGEELSLADSGEGAPPPSPRLAETHPNVRSSVPAAPPRPAEPKRASFDEALDASPLLSPTANDPFDAESAAAERPVDEVLAPESGEWLNYLADLTKQQGEHLKTGFEGLDAEAGGLAPGLILLGGKDESRILDFLKQLVDQIAIRCRVPCLYLSFERSKGDLRLQTLSRLSGASAEDIRSGKFNKDSKKWQTIIRTGEQAVEWLQRIYVVEPAPRLPVTRIRELRQGLIGSGAGASGLVAVDNLEKLSNGNDLLQSVAELKELAEALGIVVIAAVSSSLEPVHERSADMTATLGESNGQVVLEVRAGGPSSKRTLCFGYHPETHRFVEAAAASDSQAEAMSTAG